MRLHRDHNLHRDNTFCTSHHPEKPSHSSGRSLPRGDRLQERLHEAQDEEGFDALLPHAPEPNTGRQKALAGLRYQLQWNLSPPPKPKGCQGR